MQFDGYNYLTVNSVNFIDPDTDAQIQTIEKKWQEVTANVPQYSKKNAPPHQPPCEFMFCCLHPNYKQWIHTLFHAIKHLSNSKTIPQLEQTDLCPVQPDSSKNDF